MSLYGFSFTSSALFVKDLYLEEKLNAIFVSNNTGKLSCKMPDSIYISLFRVREYIFPQVYKLFLLTVYIFLRLKAFLSQSGFS